LLRLSSLSDCYRSQSLKERRSQKSQGLEDRSARGKVLTDRYPFSTIWFFNRLNSLWASKGRNFGANRISRLRPDRSGVSAQLRTKSIHCTPVQLPRTGLELSRWRGGRFACYAPHVMPQRSASHWGSRTCSFSKYRKTNSLQMSEKIEFP
jgi:hypothetical protein